MATFTVNGQSVTVEKNQKLIRYLRDTLHLTSVKDGCSEGACGTCHVLIDGKPTKACIPQTDKLEGKTIITVEGLSDWEKEVFTFAFGEAGAVHHTGRLRRYVHGGAWTGRQHSAEADPAADPLSGGAASAGAAGFPPDRPCHTTG